MDLACPPDCEGGDWPNGDSGRAKGGITWIWRFPRLGLGSGLGLQSIMVGMDLYSWEKGKREGMDFMSVTGEEEKSDFESLPRWAGAGEGEDSGEARREVVGMWLERGGQGIDIFSKY